MFYGYRMGYFEDKVTFKEIKRIGKYAINMYLIALSGHLLLRYYASPIIEKHREFSEYELQRKASNDFLIQRNYLKEKQTKNKESTGTLLK
mmetsp:Transcript_24131/g.24053  ORF Transcript_24131/g.24053 Transcript_24131/m.24053 type:complete len:91 (+) Transcript_24131:258-530(+)